MPLAWESSIVFKNVAVTQKMNTGRRDVCCFIAARIETYNFMGVPPKPPKKGDLWPGLHRGLKICSRG